MHVASACAGALEGRDERRVLVERSVANRLVHSHQVLEEDPARADRQVTDLRVAHLALRQPDRLAGRLQRRVWVLAPEPVEHRRLSELDGVARPGRRAAPAVEHDERYEVEAAPANRCEGVGLERRATDEGAVDRRLREELGGVLGLDRAAVEHRQVEQALDEAVRLLGQRGRGGLAGADRPDRLVCDHELLVRARRERDRLDLDLQDELGVAGLALLERLADAGDHGKTGLERGPRAAGDHLVRVAEEVPPLRVADERPLDAELEQHRRRDLAGVGTARLPVDVLRVDRPAALDRGRERDERRAEDDVDARRRVEAVEELAHLGRAFEHLPVAGDQHRLNSPGSQRRRGALCPRAARARRRRRSTPR